MMSKIILYLAAAVVSLDYVRMVRGCQRKRCSACRRKHAPEGYVRIDGHRICGNCRGNYV
jgi:hypothetical protein